MRVFIILSLMLLTSCGYHLRGAVELSPELSQMKVIDAGDGSDIIYDLRQKLRDRGILLSDEADMTLRIRGESYSRQVISVDSQGSATEYGLEYKVRIGLLGKQGTVWIPDELILIQRDLHFESSAVLATSSEENLLYDEMRQDAVMQIMRRLEYARAPFKDEAIKAKSK